MDYIKGFSPVCPWLACEILTLGPRKKQLHVNLVAISKFFKSPFCVPQLVLTVVIILVILIVKSSK